jgi:hypothetical protein
MPAHFKAYFKQIQQKHTLHAIIKGDACWPSGAQDRDVLSFLAHVFSALIFTKNCLPMKRLYVACIKI